MRTALPVLLSLFMLTACGDENPEKDDPIDPTDGDITETDTDGGDTQEDDTPPSPDSLTINADSYASGDLFADDNKLQVFVGDDNIQLSYTVDPPDTEVTWSSSKARVVSVSDSGELTFKSDGAVEITVSAGDASDSIIVEVADSLARNQFQLQQQRHTAPVIIGPGGEGGEGGEIIAGVYSNSAYVRTSATLENIQPMSETQEIPVPIVLPLDRCTAAINGGWNTSYYPSWRSGQVSAVGFTLTYSFCGLDPQVEGPYVLTKPMTITSASDASPYAGGEGDTAGWSSEDNICALAVEGHNSFIWQDHTIPEDAGTQLLFRADVAGKLSSSGAFEISVVDTDTGEIVASSNNQTFSVQSNYWTQANVSITIPETLAGKTVDILVDVTGRPKLQTAHGEDNFWFDNLQLSAVLANTGDEQPVFVPAGGEVALGSSDSIVVPIGNAELISDDSCDSTEKLKPLQLFEARTHVLNAVVNNLGTGKRRVFIPHNEEQVYVRNIDTFTNTSALSGAADFAYSAGFGYGGNGEAYSGRIANRRGFISIPQDMIWQHAAAIVVGDENNIAGNWGTVSGNSSVTFNSGETIALMSFIPVAKYYGQGNGGPNETFLTPFVEDIVSSFASDPLESEYAIGITTDIWDNMQGWSNPDPLTPVPGDSASPDTGF